EVQTSDVETARNRPGYSLAGMAVLVVSPRIARPIKESPTMSKRLITVGHSPDPDDAFMFYALAHNKLETGNLEFRHELQDIETLNRRALRGELEVTAI